MFLSKNVDLVYINIKFGGIRGGGLYLQMGPNSSAHSLNLSHEC
jgi:hypothetical protein